MKRTVAALFVLAALAVPHTAIAKNHQGGFWRWLSVGYGQGRHAYNLCPSCSPRTLGYTPYAGIHGRRFQYGVAVPITSPGYSYPSTNHQLVVPRLAVPESHTPNPPVAEASPVAEATDAN